jgi:hypothetical protein
MKQSLNNEVSMMAHAMDSFYVKRQIIFYFFITLFLIPYHTKMEIMHFKS